MPLLGESLDCYQILFVGNRREIHMLWHQVARLASHGQFWPASWVRSSGQRKVLIPWLFANKRQTFLMSAQGSQQSILGRLGFPLLFEANLAHQSRMTDTDFLFGMQRNASKITVYPSFCTNTDGERGRGQENIISIHQRHCWIIRMEHLLLTYTWENMTI